MSTVLQMLIVPSIIVYALPKDEAQRVADPRFTREHEDGSARVLLRRVSAMKPVVVPERATLVPLEDLPVVTLHLSVSPRQLNAMTEHRTLPEVIETLLSLFSQNVIIADAARCDSSSEFSDVLVRVLTDSDATILHELQDERVPPMSLSDLVPAHATERTPHVDELPPVEVNTENPDSEERKFSIATQWKDAVALFNRAPNDARDLFTGPQEFAAFIFDCEHQLRKEKIKEFFAQTNCFTLDCRDEFRRLISTAGGDPQSALIPKLASNKPS
jgi:hypothetical protein